MNCNIRPRGNDFWNKNNCIRKCGGDLLGAGNRVIPGTRENTTWKDEFVAMTYRSNQVYTDFILKIEKDQLNSGGVQACEAFGLTEAFFRSIGGTQTTQIMTLSVAISDKRFGLSDLEDTRALVYPIFEAKRTTNGSSCTAAAVTGAGGRIARVLAHPDTELFAQIILTSGKSLKPLAGLATSGEGSGAADLLKFLLNGELSGYAPDVAFIADNLQLDVTTDLGDNTKISTYPLSTITRQPKNFNSLVYDVQISGQTLASFSITQEVSESGPLFEAKSFGVETSKRHLVEFDSRDRELARKSIEDALTQNADAYGYITESATYADPEKLHQACEDIEDALAEFSLSDMALKSLKATMLFDFKDKSRLLEPKYRNTCLSATERKDAARYPHLSGLTHEHDRRTGENLSNLTCVENYGEDASFTAGEIGREAYKELIGLYGQTSSSKRLFPGALLSKIGGGKLAPLEAVQKFGPNRFCFIYSQDSAAGRNTSCRFAFRATTLPPNGEHVWVGIQATTGNARYARPEIESYSIGINPKNYVRRTALSSHPTNTCKDEVHHFD